MLEKKYQEQLKHHEIQQILHQAKIATFEILIEYKRKQLQVNQKLPIQNFV